MSSLKTTANDASVTDFINTVPDKTKKADSFTLLKLYSRITGEKPRMWGTSIVGFGVYHYKSKRSSQEGDWPLIGFSPRKQSLTLYFTDGFGAHTQLLSKLGRHKISKGCLYINKLADIDMTVLQKLIAASYKAACSQHGSK